MADIDDPIAELRATGALVLLVGALIAGVIGAVEWGSGSAFVATSICAASAIGFAVSVAWFVVEGQRADEAAAELPFPSWLRSEADA